MKIIKKNIIEGFISKNFPDAIYKYFSYTHHYNQLENKYNELLERFNTFIYDEFKTSDFVNEYNDSNYPATIPTLMFAKEVLRTIGNHMFISSISNMVTKNHFIDIDLEKYEDRTGGIFDETFNKYYIKLLYVRGFNLDYFVERINYFRNLMSVTISESNTPVLNESGIRLEVMNLIIKCEKKIKESEELITTTMDKIRTRVFKTPDEKDIVDYETRNKCLDRFEKIIIQDKNNILTSIKKVCEFMSNNFTQINYHVVNQITYFFDSFIDVIIDDFIGMAYVLSK